MTLRVNGVLTPATGKALTAEDLRGLLLPLLTSEQTKELESAAGAGLLLCARGHWVDFGRIFITSAARLRRAFGCCPPRCRRWSRCTCRRSWDS